MTAPILTEEQVTVAARKSADTRNERSSRSLRDETPHSAHKEGFEQGARFALSAAEKREALWRELLEVELSLFGHFWNDDDRAIAAERSVELRAALGIDKGEA